MEFLRIHGAALITLELPDVWVDSEEEIDPILQLAPNVEFLIVNDPSGYWKSTVPLLKLNRVGLGCIWELNIGSGLFNGIGEGLYPSLLVVRMMDFKSPIADDEYDDHNCWKYAVNICREKVIVLEDGRGNTVEVLLVARDPD